MREDDGPRFGEQGRHRPLVGEVTRAGLEQPDQRPPALTWLGGVPVGLLEVIGRLRCPPDRVLSLRELKDQLGALAGGRRLTQSTRKQSGGGDGRPAGAGPQRGGPEFGGNAGISRRRCMHQLQGNPFDRRTAVAQQLRGPAVRIGLLERGLRRAYRGRDDRVEELQRDSVVDDLCTDE
jgi:hypothetical protein